MPNVKQPTYPPLPYTPFSHPPSKGLLQRLEDALDWLLECDPRPSLGCTLCGWEGEPEQLTLCRDSGGRYMGCPICHHDQYLKKKEK